MEIIIILILIIAVILTIFIRKNKKQNETSENNGYYNSINTMSYNQLDKMHNELLVLVNEIPSPILPGLDNSQNEILKQKYHNKINEKLPYAKQIYGCVTYGDAEKLNQAVVKRLDYLYDNRRHNNVQ